MESIAFIKNILSLRWGHALGILRAWTWTIFHIGFLYQRRKSLQKNYEIDNIYKKSIVIAYYLFAKKTCKELKY
tara:strand:- start:283 stop:504 length:222 start_codon:yes stop_codon:yes gene_type:complete